MYSGISSSYRFWEFHQFPFDNDGDDEQSVDLEKELMVNSDIVDNEFTGRDVSVAQNQ